jgi:hypothetical protein
MDLSSPAYAWTLNFSAANVQALHKTEPARVRAGTERPMSGTLP